MDEFDEDKTRILPPGKAPGGGAAVGGALGNTLAIGYRLHEYVIERLIGEGGFGVVYLARDLHLERTVAIKEYMPSALASRQSDSSVAVKSERYAETFHAGLKSFVNEARLLAQFDEPALVKVHRFWEDHGTAYMVMPYYKGPTLKQWLRDQKGPPSEQWLKDFVAPLIDALQTLHDRNIFHRDIAPDNVLLLENGQPLLLDFGAARRIIGDLTQALTVVLKPGYAPMEQYAEVATMRQGPWTDVYALAATLYFAAIGRAPPPSVGRMMNDDCKPASDLAAGRYSASFLAAIDRGLRLKPGDRPQSMEEFRALLLGPGVRAPAVKEPRGPRAVRPAAAPAPPKRGFPIWAIGLLVLLVVIGIAAVFALRSSTPSGPQDPKPTPQGTPVASARELAEDIYAARSSSLEVNAYANRPKLRIHKDGMQFSVVSSQAGYLYGFMAGTDNTLWLMFPNAGDRMNRIEARTAFKIPSRSTIQVTGPAGIDHMVFIVSARLRDPPSESLMKPGQSVEYDLAAATAAVRRGDPSILAGEVRCPGGAAAECDRSYGAAQVEIEETDGP